MKNRWTTPKERDPYLELETFEAGTDLGSQTTETTLVSARGHVGVSIGRISWTLVFDFAPYRLKLLNIRPEARNCLDPASISTSPNQTDNFIPLSI